MKKIILALSCALIIAAACGKHDENILNEDKLIEGYINYLNNIDGLFDDPDTVQYIQSYNINKGIIKNGDASKLIKNGDSVYFHFIASYLVGSSSVVVFDTNLKEEAKRYGLDTIKYINGSDIIFRDNTPIKVVAGKGGLIAGLDKGLLTCSNGEECLIIFNSDLGYGSNSVGIIPPYSPICFHIQIIKVK